MAQARRMYVAPMYGAELATGPPIYLPDEETQVCGHT